MSPANEWPQARELVRLHMQLSDEAAAYQNEIQALVVVLFPEFTRVFADPCLPTALTVLKAFPSAQAVVEAGVEALFQLFRARDPSALWSSDRPEVSSLRRTEWEQRACNRWTIGELADSLRSVGAYSSKSGTFGCRNRATPHK
jgi:hypothetical protein